MVSKMLLTVLDFSTFGIYTMTLWAVWNLSVGHIWPPGHILPSFKGTDQNNPVPSSTATSPEGAKISTSYWACKMNHKRNHKSPFICLCDLISKWRWFTRSSFPQHSRHAAFMRCLFRFGTNLSFYINHNEKQNTLLIQNSGIQLNHCSLKETESNM